MYFLKKKFLHFSPKTKRKKFKKKKKNYIYCTAIYLAQNLGICSEQKKYFCHLKH